jgi:hypothetical protein
LLYLPLDKLMQATGAGVTEPSLAPVLPPSGAAMPAPASGADPRSRESARTRDGR